MKRTTVGGGGGGVGGVGGRGSGVATDLLGCFPSRAHLKLLPKPLCSPTRASDSANRRHLMRPTSRGRANPLFKTKTKQMRSPEMDEEPSSPKVTCAGQIKVRRKATAGLKPSIGYKNWLEAIGLRKDMTHFFRGLRFGARCFGSFNGAADCSSEEEEEKDEKHDGVGNCNEAEEEAKEEEEERNELYDEASSSSVPPPNALLLTRCRSAPATRWPPPREEARRDIMEEVEEEGEVLMGYGAPDFFRLSTEIVKETWMVGGRLDPLIRSRSWKR